MSILFPLREGFQLVHEPITDSDVDAKIFKEEAEVALKLRERLAHSTGGAFLITGFRGVGKTTAVRQALRQLSGDGGRQVIDVTIPVARPATTTALLFEVTRRLVERLTETDTLASLSPEVRSALLTAYRRTSMAYKQTSTQSRETQRGFELGGSLPVGKLGISSKWSRSRKRAESEAVELSFLAYTETDVEHDFLRIVELLGRDDAARRGLPARLASRLRLTKATKPLGAQIVVVFDEIDKLTEADGGLKAFEVMLGGLKNLLASAGVHFVVVAGVDLHDEWLRESATANSLYRSVFAWQGYVGCSWQAAELLLEAAETSAQPADREVLAGYLEYRGRGVIRNVLYEFNELVEWKGGLPYIEVDGIAEDRVRLLGELSDVLQRGFADLADSMLAAPSDKDRFKQAAYFTADWVLRAGRDAFTVADVMDPGRGTPLDSVLRPSQEVVHAVLKALAGEAYLKMTVRDSDVATHGPEADPYPEQYVLSHRLQERLALIARASPRARAEFGREDQLGEGGELGGEARRVVQELVGMKYEVGERLGQGGFGTVWKGIDLNSGESVAIKVIRTGDRGARERVRREVQMLGEANDPGVVRIRETIHWPDRTMIVTDLVEGESLADLKALPAPLAVGIVLDVLRTVETLHERGIVHADIKPSNIIRTQSRPVLVDLGTARMTSEPGSERITRDTVSGTPAYMPPELFLGERASAPSDIWAVGILLLELLAGEVPSPRTPPALAKTISSLSVSEELKRVLHRALSSDPTARPAAEEMRMALLRTPEGQGS
jgi:Protein kinase domain/AAA ATPase domain